MKMSCNENYLCSIVLIKPKLLKIKINSKKDLNTDFLLFDKNITRSGMQSVKYVELLLP